MGRRQFRPFVDFEELDYSDDIVNSYNPVLVIQTISVVSVTRLPLPGKITAANSIASRFCRYWILS